jgi:hypothetical protein
MLPPTRRELGSLALAGTTALAISGLVQSRRSHAEISEKAAVDQAVEALRRAILDADEAKLRELVTHQLSYGLWPSGRIQNRFEFINNIAAKKIIYTSMNYSEPKHHHGRSQCYCTSPRGGRSPQQRAGLVSGI